MTVLHCFGNANSTVTESKASVNSLKIVELVSNFAPNTGRFGRDHKYGLRHGDGRFRFTRVKPQADSSIRKLDWRLLPRLPTPDYHAALSLQAMLSLEEVRVRTLGVFLVVVLSCLSALGHNTPAVDCNEIALWLGSGVSARSLQKIVQQRGISFEPDGLAASSLRRAGADKEFL